jgi:hypothetical protein
MVHTPLGVQFSARLCLTICTSEELELARSLCRAVSFALLLLLHPPTSPGINVRSPKLADAQSF